MKSIITLALCGMIAIIVGNVASAGGLAPPLESSPTPVARPAPDTPSAFAGAYVGLSFGRTEAVTDIPDYDIRECRFGNQHTQRKCGFGGHGASPEIVELERGNSPWNGWDGGEPVVYDDKRGIMYGEADSVFTYTIDAGTELVPVKGKDAENVLIDTITEMVADESTVGGFVGYRVDVGPAVLGVEAGTDGTMTTIEAQAGLPMGNVMPYVFAGAGSYDSVSGNTYGGGVDLMVTDNIMIGGKMTVGEFGATETQTAGLRVAFNF